MSEIIQTIDCDRWSEPDEQRRVKHPGMIKAKDAFDQLYTHLLSLINRYHKYRKNPAEKPRKA